MKILDLLREDIKNLQENPPPPGKRPFAWQFDPQTDPLNQLKFRTPGAQGPIMGDPMAAQNKLAFQGAVVPGQTATDPDSMAKLAGVSTSGNQMRPGAEPKTFHGTMPPESQAQRYQLDPSRPGGTGMVAINPADGQLKSPTMAPDSHLSNIQVPQGTPGINFGPTATPDDDTNPGKKLNVAHKTIRGLMLKEMNKRSR